VSTHRLPVSRAGTNASFRAIPVAVYCNPFPFLSLPFANPSIQSLQHIASQPHRYRSPTNRESHPPATSSCFEISSAVGSPHVWLHASRVPQTWARLICLIRLAGSLPLASHCSPSLLLCFSGETGRRWCYLVPRKIASAGKHESSSI